MKLMRSKTNRIFAGVIGGLGEYLRIDPTVLRLLLLTVFLIFTPVTLLVYVLLYLLLPLNPFPSRYAGVRRLYRDPARGRAYGILAGLGLYLGVPPFLLRLLFLVLLYFLRGLPLLFYFVALLVIPRYPATDSHTIEV